MLTLSFSPLVPASALWALAAAVAVARPSSLALVSRGPVALVRAAGARARRRGARQSLARPGGAGAGQGRRRCRDRPLDLADARRPRRDDRQGARRAAAAPRRAARRRAALRRRRRRRGRRRHAAVLGALATRSPTCRRDRLAGVVMVTDGVVHDIPASAALLGFQRAAARARHRPRRTSATGDRARSRRRASASSARTRPSAAQVLERGGTGSALVTVRRDGQQILRREVRTGAPFSLTVRIEHGGPNVVEIEAEALAGRAHAPPTTAPSSRSRASARSCACSSSPASRMPASAPGAIC